METRATLRGVRLSDQKGRLVADQARYTDRRSFLGPPALARGRAQACEILVVVTRETPACDECCYPAGAAAARAGGPGRLDRSPDVDVLPSADQELRSHVTERVD